MNWDLLQGTVFFALLCGVVNYVLFAKNFFHLPSWEPEQKVVGLRQAVLPAALYFLVIHLFTPLIFTSLQDAIASLPPSSLPGSVKINLYAQISQMTVFLLILLFTYRTLDPTLRREIFRAKKNSSPLHSDILFGLFTCFIAYPFVSFLDEFAELITIALFNAQGAEQDAVELIRQARPYVFSLSIMGFFAVIAAPIMEEILFRGFLQSYLRNALGKKAAILITALIFACFHYTFNQGIGNIPIIASLFGFSLYLCFAYEKTRSLYASITMHMAFNAINFIQMQF